LGEPLECQRQPLRVRVAPLGRGHGKQQRDFAFAANGQWIAAATHEESSHDTIRVWHLFTGEEILKLPVFQGRAWSMAFLPDGRRLMAGLANTTVLIGDVPALRHVSPLRSPRSDARLRTIRVAA
jgi:WD40 repeat protein